MMGRPAKKHQESEGQSQSMHDDIKKLLLGQERMQEQLASLKDENSKKDARIKALEDRVSSLERLHYINDVVIQGLKTTHQTWARRAAPEDGTEGSDAPPQEKEDLEKQVIDFFHSRDIDISQGNISSTFSPKKSPKAKSQSIIISFCSNKAKTDLLKQTKKLKGTKVFVNERLTRENSLLFKQARELRKKEVIKDTFTRNGNIFIVLNGNTPEERKIELIKSVTQLQNIESPNDNANV